MNLSGITRPLLQYLVAQVEDFVANARGDQAAARATPSRTVNFSRITTPASQPPLARSVTARSNPVPSHSPHSFNLQDAGNLAVGLAATVALGLVASQLGRSAQVVMGLGLVLASAAACVGSATELQESDAATDVDAARPHELSPIEAACGQVERSMTAAQTSRAQRQNISQNHPEGLDASVSSSMYSFLSENHPNANNHLSYILSQDVQRIIGPIVAILDSGVNRDGSYQGGLIAIVTQRNVVFKFSHNGSGSDLSPVQVLNPVQLPQPISSVPYHNALLVSPGIRVVSAVFANEIVNNTNPTHPDGRLNFGTNDGLLQNYNSNPYLILISGRPLNAPANSTAVSVGVVNLTTGRMEDNDICPEIIARRQRDAGQDVAVSDVIDGGVDAN